MTTSNRAMYGVNKGCSVFKEKVVCTFPVRPDKI